MRPVKRNAGFDPGVINTEPDDKPKGSLQAFANTLPDATSTIIAALRPLKSSLKELV